MRFLKIIAVAAVVILSSNPPASAQGFDGLSWGSPISAVQGDRKDLMRGKITAVRQRLNRMDDHPAIYAAFKAYYFCGDAGLCGGNLNLIIHRRMSGSVEGVMWQVQSILGHTYGHQMEGRRTSTLSWSMPDMIVSLESGVDREVRSIAPEDVAYFPTVEVSYRSPQYFSTQAEAEAEVAAALKNEMAAWEFKF